MAAALLSVIAGTASGVQGFAKLMAERQERLERERKRRHRRRLVGGVIAGTLLVATFIAGILALQTDDQEPPSDLPAGVDGYDIDGDNAPDFVKIGGEVLPVTSSSKDAWWVPFLPFLGVVLAALLTAGASLWSDRRRADLQDQISEIEALVKGGPTAEPAQVTTGSGGAG
jgi:hypothetical protein